MDSNPTSTNKKKVGLILALVFVLIVFVAGVIALVRREDQKPTSTTNEIRIAITEEGFSPATISVNSGTTVVWVNNTSSPTSVGANPYPDATDLPELKSEDIAPGETYSFTFGKAGSYTYADYTRPTLSGTVQVK